MGLGWLMVGILAYDDDCLFGCSSCVLLLCKDCRIDSWDVCIR